MDLPRRLLYFEVATSDVVPSDSESVTVSKDLVSSGSPASEIWVSVDAVVTLEV